VFERGVELPAATLPVPVHGDLHEAQILVRDGAISALLDVDTVTLGDRADDWALLIAHLDLHALSAHGSVSDRVRDYRDLTRAVASREVDEASLRVRVAASVFGQATGPFRVQSPGWATETRARLARAVDWIEAAE
jgi:aminoglycoside phosphotransferase (APT) family kinase protein